MEENRNSTIGTAEKAEELKPEDLISVAGAGNDLVPESVITAVPWIPRRS